MLKKSTPRSRRTHTLAFKGQLLGHAADAFGSVVVEPVALAPLHAKIGQLTLENDFLEYALTQAGLLSTRR